MSDFTKNQAMDIYSSDIHKCLTKAGLICQHIIFPGTLVHGLPTLQLQEVDSAFLMYDSPPGGASSPLMTENGWSN